MALTLVNVGDVITAAQHNQAYNLLKGIAGNGESITLVYNAAGVIALQPSSDPAAGTELIQVKNNAGTVQSALSSDGKFYAADGVVGTPGLTFEGEKTTGMWRPAASTLALSLGGSEAMRITATALTLAAAASRVVPGATSLSLRNNANGADNLILTDAGVATIRAGLTLTAGAFTMGAATSQLVPGATSFSHRDTANANDNLLITDAGVVTIRSTLTVSGASVSVGTTPAAAGAVRIPNNTTISARNSTNNGDRVIATVTAADLYSFAEGNITSTPSTGVTRLYDTRVSGLSTTKTSLADGTGHMGAGQAVWTT